MDDELIEKNLESILNNKENEIIPIINFEYTGKKVRTVYKDGKVWFVAIDIGEILELTDVRKSINLLDEDERNSIPLTDKLGRFQLTSIITESGLY